MLHTCRTGDIIPQMGASCPHYPILAFEVRDFYILIVGNQQNRDCENEVRPHSLLKGRAPEEYAKAVAPLY